MGPGVGVGRKGWNPVGSNLWSRGHSPQMFYTVPIMAFAFVCHPEVLPIYTELKE